MEEVQVELKETLLKEESKVEKKKETIAIIGTGSFAFAIAKRLLGSGFQVVFGSRKPNVDCVRDALSATEGVSVASIADAWMQAERIVFLAVPGTADVYANIVDQVDKKNVGLRVVIDVSNLAQGTKSTSTSNAEKLSELFSSAANVKVVKGFNMINLANFVDGCQNKGNEVIEIAGDDLTAKGHVVTLCHQIGCRVHDTGLLANASRLEQSNHLTFTDWVAPSFICLTFLVFNALWSFFYYFVFDLKKRPFAAYVNSYSLLKHLNKVFGFSALQLLAYVYLPSCLAAILQMHYGTKYRRFPSCVDRWLKMRKQLGLWAFLFATFHAVISISILSPAYYANWHEAYNASAPMLSRLTLAGELNIFSGIVAYIVMSLLAIASINSIAVSLNWSEWTFVQSKLGISCLSIGVLHDVFMYSAYILRQNKDNYSTAYLFQRIKLLALYVPVCVLLLRFIIGYFPPISKKLASIRRGTKDKDDKKHAV